ncbi:MAG: hypothetical protein Q7T93_16620 [Methylobacterium sp.]|uniref:hypothetical protein n=1 Tax=Methylobacterium sp. TaxID=409 RepID=UPI0027212165|nr:hypothetical protein [Methylobacterium sp.]MDO9428442.1 hypothetical protein [Methylobacterium sp.]
MSTTPYRVCDGANLSLFPRGTQVGTIVHLTEADALYERDMGRITAVEAPVPGETQGHPVDSVSGEPMKLTDQERAALPAIGNVEPGEPAVLGESSAKPHRAR